MFLQGWRTGRALQSPSDLPRPPAPKLLGPHSSSLAPSPRPGPPLLHNWRIMPAGLLGANTNPRTVPEKPLPRGLALQHMALGTPKSQCETHCQPATTRGPLGAPPVIQGGKRAGPSKPLAMFKGPLHKNAGYHIPVPQRPHLVPLLRSPHSRRIGPAGLLWSNSNAKP